jgi:hypothetical protein
MHKKAYLKTHNLRWLFAMIEPMEKDKCCSFCDKHVDFVECLIVDTDANICNECIEICSTIVEMNQESKIINMRLH